MRKKTKKTVPLKEMTIEFSIYGVGDVIVMAKNEKDAIRQFDEMGAKEFWRDGANSVLSTSRESALLRLTTSLSRPTCGL